MVTATYLYELFTALDHCVLKNHAPKMEVTCLSKKRRDEDMDVSKGKMTVQEAGKKGGAKGGPRVRELIQEGKEHEDE
jgi:hypothetical protein